MIDIIIVTHGEIWKAMLASSELIDGGTGKRTGIRLLI